VLLSSTPPAGVQPNAFGTFISLMSYDNQVGVGPVSLGWGCGRCWGGSGAVLL